MILSASRRTDLPAFYTEWFYNRLREGYVLARGPYRPHRLSHIPLTAEVLDGVVFWSKNPAPLLTGPGREALRLLDSWDVPYYLQFTVTPYGPEMEPGLPPKTALLRLFRRLADEWGPERLVWRYDPVIVNETYTVSFHRERFAEMAAFLTGATEECVFSFLDLYPKAKARSAGVADRPVPLPVQRELAFAFSESAARAGMRLRACCEELNRLDAGILPGACIDPRRLERLGGFALRAKKDAGQRPGCGCAESADIGGYSTCTHGCVYCYATDSAGKAEQNRAQHDPRSPLLTGWPAPEDTIMPRKVRSLRTVDAADSGKSIASPEGGQLRLF